MYDILIKGGTVIDGTGAAAMEADVAIQDEKIAAIGSIDPSQAREVIDAVASFEYAQGGEFHPIGQPFEPARHTWVGARLALFCMPMNGGDDHGGWAEFGAVRVEAIETL